MAYMSQTEKTTLSPAIKALLKKYCLNASIAVRHHATLVLNIKSGPIDFIGNLNKVCSSSPYADRYCAYQPAVGSIDINPYHYQNHFDGEALAFLSALIPLMYGPDYYDRSDIQTDYFDCSHYIEVNVGAWNKPYKVTV